MSFRRTAPAGLISVGFQTMSLSNSTAVALNSTTKFGTTLLISVETQAARMRDDGTAPALTTGVLLPTGLHWFEGHVSGDTDMQFQRSTGTSKVSILAYRPPGQQTS